MKDLIGSQQQRRPRESEKLLLQHRRLTMGEIMTAIMTIRKIKRSATKREKRTKKESPGISISISRSFRRDSRPSIMTATEKKTLKNTAKRHDADTNENADITYDRTTTTGIIEGTVVLRNCALFVVPMRPSPKKMPKHMESIGRNTLHTLINTKPVESARTSTFLS